MKTQFNRSAISFSPLSERVNKLDVNRDMIDPRSYSPVLNEAAAKSAAQAAEEIIAARAAGASVILTFGAHSIKNGLVHVFKGLMDGGWVTHFATNGAGVIHDWEFAYQGLSGENVQRYAAEGRFGIWQETGLYINLAIAIGSFRGLGYGESIGAMVTDDGLLIPEDDELVEAITAGGKKNADDETLIRAAAAADLKQRIQKLSIKPGKLVISHQHRECGLQAAAFSAGIPFTAHPMFGHDIIYTHPMNCGGAIGRTAERDFLTFTESVNHLEDGVYLSVGSAVMSPMIFEKALSMSRNIAHREGRKIENFSIHVVDLAKSSWNWENDGEPPQDNPAYYLRFCKTFSRMGGRMTYTSADNRDWLVALLQNLKTTET